VAEPMTSEQVPAGLPPELSTARMRFWVCLNREHRFVDWVDGVATCPDCGLTSEMTGRFAATAKQVGREEVLRELGIHPEQTAERLKQPARPDSREEILARLIPDVAPTVLREAADAYEDDRDALLGSVWGWLNARADRIEQGSDHA
jgi:hypothetical protein